MGPNLDVGFLRTLLRLEGVQRRRGEINAKLGLAHRDRLVLGSPCRGLRSDVGGKSCASCCGDPRVLCWVNAFAGVDDLTRRIAPDQTSRKHGEGPGDTSDERWDEWARGRAGPSVDAEPDSRSSLGEGAVAASNGRSGVAQLHEHVTAVIHYGHPQTACRAAPLRRAPLAPWLWMRLFVTGNPVPAEALRVRQSQPRSGGAQPEPLVVLDGRTNAILAHPAHPALRSAHAADARHAALRAATRQPNSRTWPTAWTSQPGHRAHTYCTFTCSSASVTVSTISGLCCTISSTSLRPQR